MVVCRLVDRSPSALDNALEAMAVVTAQPRELVVRSLAREDGQVAVAVRCISVGIAPQTADRLLKSFYTTKQDGMGLGLSICRSIVEGHGG